MNVNRCCWEDELLDALVRGFVGSELSAHLEECASCSELRVVAGGVLDERRQAVAESPVPASGTMLFRMQMRHRQEAQATARRSLLVGQAVTLGVVIALMLGIFGAVAALELREVFAAVRVSTPLLIAVATWLLLAPIGGYIAIRQK